MRPTEILMNEHRVIERVLDALEAASARLEAGEDVRAGFFLDAADFIAGFADGTHHRKEEDVLFGAMIAGGSPDHGGPIDMMLEEHEQARLYTRAIRDGARALQRGETGAHRKVAASARHYIALLRDHIVKEDDMLFPMANDIFTPGEEAEVLAAFEKVGASAADHDATHWLALAARIEAEAVRA